MGVGWVLVVCAIAWVQTVFLRSGDAYSFGCDLRGGFELARMVLITVGMLSLKCGYFGIMMGKKWCEWTYGVVAHCKARVGIMPSDILLPAEPLTPTYIDAVGNSLDFDKRKGCALESPS